MTLRTFAALAVVTLAPAVAHAQVGIFVTPIAMRISNSTSDPGIYSFLGQNVKSRFFYGVNLGAYYDVKTPALPVRVGAEIRDSILHANNASINNFNLGLRISGKPFHNAFKPYIEPFAGLGTTEAPNTAIHVSKGEYGVYGGLDYETRHHIDIRAIEVGYGSVVTASSETIGGSLTVPAATFFSISAGFVIRIP